MNLTIYLRITQEVFLFKKKRKTLNIKQSFYVSLAVSLNFNNPQNTLLYD